MEVYKRRLQTETYDMNKRARFLEKPISRKRRLCRDSHEELVISMRKVSFSSVGFVHKTAIISKIQKMVRKFMGRRYRAATKIQAMYRGYMYRKRKLHLLKFAFYK